MSLRLTNCRLIDPSAANPAWAAYAAALKPDGTPAAPSGARRPMKLAELGGIDLEQLIACVRACVGAIVSGDAVIAGTVGESDEEAGEIFTMPIEWWDVVGADGQPVYQLWLYHADCGSLFVAGTTGSVGGFIQTYFEASGDEFSDGAALAAAKTDAEARVPDSELRGYTVGSG